MNNMEELVKKLVEKNYNSYKDDYKFGEDSYKFELEFGDKTIPSVILSKNVVNIDLFTFNSILNGKIEDTFENEEKNIDWFLLSLTISTHYWISKSKADNFKYVIGFNNKLRRKLVEKHGDKFKDKLDYITELIKYGRYKFDGKPYMNYKYNHIFTYG